MKYYKVIEVEEHTDFNYIVIEQREERRLYLLQKIQLDEENGFTFNQDGSIKSFKGYDVKEEEIKEDELIDLLYLEYEDVLEEIKYNKTVDEYIHTAKMDGFNYSMLKKEDGIDFTLKDELFEKSFHTRIKQNWSRIVEEIGDETVFKYFDGDSFDSDNIGLIVEEYVKVKPFINVEELESIIKDFDFNKYDDKLIGIELLDIQIREYLDDIDIEVDLKEIIRENPDYFDLNKLIKGEEKAILIVFEEVEIMKDNRLMKVEVKHEKDMTDEVIQSLSNGFELDDPTVDNKIFTEEEMERRNEKETFIEYDNFIEL